MVSRKRFVVIRFCMLAFVPAVFSGCGDSETIKNDAAVKLDGGVCGTSSNPGILKVTDVLPVPGSTVTNGPVTHSFTVPNAPAQFTAFSMRYGSNHTAGGATPDIVVHGSLVGNSMVYTFTVNSWSIVPGHVELKASAGYQTKEGCAWVFPSPILSYDVVPGAGLDGGVDGQTPLDGAVADAPITVDAPMVVDAALDVTSDAPAIDRPAVDALAIDGAVDAGSP